MSGGSPKKHVHPEPMKVILFGKTIFTDVTKDLKMRLGWALNPTSFVRIEEERRTQRGEDTVKLEAKIGVMCLPAKEHQGFQATARI